MTEQTSLTQSAFTKETEEKKVGSELLPHSDQPKNKDKKKQVKIHLKNMRSIAKWKYKCENAECTLCHKDLMMPFQEVDSDKLNGDVTIGLCNHGFHAICINSWLSLHKKNCPHCGKDWSADKNVSTSVYVYARA